MQTQSQTQSQSQLGGPAIEIVRLNKWYGTFHVLRDIDLTVRRGERIVIAGPSGSGKSTLIRCVNGLEPFEKGRLVVDGTDLSKLIGTVVRLPITAGQPVTQGALVKPGDTIMGMDLSHGGHLTHGSPVNVSGK